MPIVATIPGQNEEHYILPTHILEGLHGFTGHLFGICDESENRSCGWSDPRIFLIEMIRSAQKTIGGEKNRFSTLLYVSPRTEQTEEPFFLDYINCGQNLASPTLINMDARSDGAILDINSASALVFGKSEPLLFVTLGERLAAMFAHKEGNPKQVFDLSVILRPYLKKLPKSKIFDAEVTICFGSSYDQARIRDGLVKQGFSVGSVSCILPTDEEDVGLNYYDNPKKNVLVLCAR